MPSLIDVEYELKDFHQKLCSNQSLDNSKDKCNALVKAFEILLSLDSLDLESDKTIASVFKLVLLCTRKLCTMDPMYQMESSAYLFKRNWLSICTSTKDPYPWIQLYLQTVSNAITGNDQVKKSYHSHILNLENMMQILDFDNESLFSTFCVLLLNLTMNDYDLSVYFLKSQQALEFLNFISRATFDQDLTHYQMYVTLSIE